MEIDINQKELEKRKSKLIDEIERQNECVKKLNVLVETEKSKLIKMKVELSELKRLTDTSLKENINAIGDNNYHYLPRIYEPLRF